ncbi:MAG: hypothetical protein ACOC4G_14770 [Bacillota bacterium]
MLETVQGISKVIISTIGVWGPGILIILIYVLPRFWPKSDDYFERAYLTLAEVDDITDSILEEFPNLSWVKSVDDLINEVLSVLEKRYKLDGVVKDQIGERVKANLVKKEGWQVKWEDGVGKIEFDNKF